MLLIFLFASIPPDCVKGITFWTKINSVDTKIGVINVASMSGSYRDMFFEGSFCPKHPGEYRMVYEGTLDSRYESTYSRYYFVDALRLSRISPYYYLNQYSCYQYRVIHSTYTGSTWGNVYMEPKDGIRFIITNETSYSCTKTFNRETMTQKSPIRLSFNMLSVLLTY